MQSDGNYAAILNQPMDLEEPLGAQCGHADNAETARQPLRPTGEENKQGKEEKRKKVKLTVSDTRHCAPRPFLSEIGPTWIAERQEGSSRVPLGTQQRQGDAVEREETPVVEVGDSIRVVGLLNHIPFNGQEGTVLEVLEDSLVVRLKQFAHLVMRLKRTKVEMFQMNREAIAERKECKTTVAKGVLSTSGTEAPLEVGELVRLDILMGRPEYQGAQGVVMAAWEGEHPGKPFGEAPLLELKCPRTGGEGEKEGSPIQINEAVGIQSSHRVLVLPTTGHLERHTLQLLAQGGLPREWSAARLKPPESSSVCGDPQRGGNELNISAFDFMSYPRVVPADGELRCVSWSNGTMYSGEWRNGKPWGSGVKIKLDGHSTVHRGDFINGVPSGFVVESSPKGMSPIPMEYAGEFSGGHRHGFGVQSFPDGSKLMGKFSAQLCKFDAYGACYDGPFVSLEAGKLTVRTFQMNHEVSQVPFVSSDPDHALLVEGASQAESMARKRVSVADVAMMEAEYNSTGPTIHATTAEAIQFRPSITNSPTFTYGSVLGLPNSQCFSASITDAPMYAILGTAPSNVSYGCVDPYKEAIPQDAVVHFVHTRQADGIEKAFLLKGPMDVQGVVHAVLHCERGDAVDTRGDGPRGGEAPYTDCRQCPISALLGFKRTNCNAIQVGAPVCITGLVNMPHYNSEEGIVTKILEEHVAVTLQAGTMLRMKRVHLNVKHDIPVYRTVSSECFCHIGATGIKSSCMPIEDCHLQMPGADNPKAERLKEFVGNLTPAKRVQMTGIEEAVRTGCMPMKLGRIPTDIGCPVQ